MTRRAFDTSRNWPTHLFRCLETPYSDVLKHHNITFGPNEPATTGNWIQTAPGRGWFGMVRFYSPTEQYFDKTWQLDDITRTRP
jgi:hypothetical protein